MLPVCRGFTNVTHRADAVEELRMDQHLCIHRTDAPDSGGWAPQPNSSLRICVMTFSRRWTAAAALLTIHCVAGARADWRA
jgi:predicted protein tyrosine phosphatase